MKNKKTIKQLQAEAADHGLRIGLSTINRRRQAGWSDEKIVTTKPKYSASLPKKLYKYKGKQYSVQELANLASRYQKRFITTRTVYSRLKIGWTPQDVVEIPLEDSRRNRAYEFRGQEYSLGELYLISNGFFHTGITYNTLHDRIVRLKWDVERSVSEKRLPKATPNRGNDLPDDLLQELYQNLIYTKPFRWYKPEELSWLALPKR